jgi:hypothetical protein
MNSAPGAAANTLRRVAMSCLVSMAVVVVVSALMRHLGATPASQAAWSGELGAARVVHRVAATLVLLGAVAMAALARHGARHDRASAWALLALALALSAVGWAGGASRDVAVVLINLLGGFAMLALAARLAAPPDRPGPRALRVVAALLVLQSALGAWASATAVTPCEHWWGCSVGAVVHRATGIALLVLAIRALVCRRSPPLVLAALAMVTGLAVVAFDDRARIALVVAHNALAAASVALLARRA